jgi:uncharacterized protein YkwD
MNRTAVVALLLASSLPLAACNNKGKPHDRNRGSGSSGITSGTIGNPGGNYYGLTSVVPDRGFPAGGDAVTVNGTDFRAGVVVEFGGLTATNVVVVSPNTLTCRTPAHAAGPVDVTVAIPGGRVLRKINGFTYDPNGGVMARVADYGNPNGEEQELVELIQRARRDPAAEAQRINARRGTTLDFSGFAKRPALSPNEFLAEAAAAHANDMATRGFYGHANPEGINAVGRILDTQYDLDPSFGTNPAINTTECIGKGTGSAPGNLLTTPQDTHDAFLIDAGVPGAKHRVAILGDGPFAKNREVGLSYLHKAPSDYIVEEFAHTTRNAAFLLGMAFDDRDNDGVGRNGEGLANKTVTLSHASGFSISTTTKTAGGFSFEVFVPGTYTLTIDGQATQVTIGQDNVKVDLKSGQIAKY